MQRSSRRILCGLFVTLCIPSAGPGAEEKQDVAAQEAKKPALKRASGARKSHRRLPNERHGRPPLKYTIPILDLAKEQFPHSVVDREKDQYLGQPTTILLEDGKTILVVYPRGHSAGALVMRTSPDGGRTWSKPLATPKSWETSRHAPTIYRLTDSHGKKRLVLFSGLYPVRTSISVDDGKTWSELEAVGDFGGQGTMASLVHLKGWNDHYMAFFWDDGRFLSGGRNRSREGSPMGGIRGYAIFQTRSINGGVSWQDPVNVVASDELDLQDPAAVLSPDGEEIAILLSNRVRTKNSHMVRTRDGCETWTAPRELPGALTGDRHVIRYAPDGRVFMTFRDTARFSRTRGDWVAWVGTYEDIIEGREGQYRVRLMDNHWRADCGYGGIEVLEDGTLVVTGYGHWVKGEKPYVVSLRLRLDDLDRRLAAQLEAEKAKEAAAKKEESAGTSGSTPSEK